MHAPLLSAVLAFFVLLVPPAAAERESESLKAAAQKAFGGADYRRAISLLNDVVAASPDDAEAHYRLGVAIHYLAYDSLPLTGYDMTVSEEALSHFRLAVRLDPRLGDACYFIGAEYGARFVKAMQARDLQGMESALRSGRNERGFPDWLVEYNRNMLNSCPPDAILLTEGDAITGSAWYLQYVEGFRRDVTVVPSGVLGESWYLLAHLERPDLTTSPVHIGWGRSQVLSLSPFKWKTNTVSIPVAAQDVRSRYGIRDPEASVEWLVEPDLSRAGSSKTYLSQARAALIEILQSNAFTRPVHFAFGTSPGWKQGLEAHLQMSGITHGLLPVTVGDATPALDVEATEALMMAPENFRHLRSITEMDYTRIGDLPRNYRAAYMALIEHFQQAGELGRAAAVVARMREVLPEDILPMEPGLQKWLEWLEAQDVEGE